MKTTTVIMIAVAALALAAGCGSDEEQEEAQEATTALTDTEGAAETAEDLLEEAEEALEDARTLDLQEQNNSGIGGTVELTPKGDGTVEVKIELDRRRGGPHPAHVHEGTCASLDPAPRWPLEDVVNGKSETTIDVDLRDLIGSEYAVNVHESAENADVYVACADVRNQ
jgi:hypothetical protein